MGSHAAKDKKKSRAGAYLAVTAGTFALAIGGVFAANSITLNGGGTIEFGQGLVSTSTCDAGLTASINQTYNATSEIFEVSTVEISGIKDFACDGKNINVSLVDASGTVCSVDGTHTSGPNQDSFLINEDSDSADDDITKTVTVASGCDASTVLKVAITTS